jgi:hypothetical protein
MTKTINEKRYSTEIKFMITITITLVTMLIGGVTGYTETVAAVKQNAKDNKEQKILLTAHIAEYQKTDKNVGITQSKIENIEKLLEAQNVDIKQLIKNTAPKD